MSIGDKYQNIHTMEEVEIIEIDYSFSSPVVVTDKSGRWEERLFLNNHRLLAAK